MKKKVLIRMKKISIDLLSHQLVPKTHITCHAGCFGFSSRGNLLSQNVHENLCR